MLEVLHVMFIVKYSVVTLAANSIMEQAVQMYNKNPCQFPIPIANPFEFCTHSIRYHSGRRGKVGN